MGPSGISHRGRLGVAVAVAVLAAGGCAHGVAAGDDQPVARQLPSCAGCHEGGPWLKDQPPGLCRRCHGSAHRAAAEAAKQGASGSTEQPRCLVCHDVHGVHGRKRP